MDLLETQVSDLRSFLGAAAAPQSPEVVSPNDVPYSPGPLRANSHHSSLSAPGDNSAQQPPPSPLEPRPGTAKRRADDGDADSAAKQQRSKRNRVGRFIYRWLIFIFISTNSGLRSTSQSLGKPAPADSVDGCSHAAAHPARPPLLDQTAMHRHTGLTMLFHRPQ